MCRKHNSVQGTEKYIKDFYDGDLDCCDNKQPVCLYSCWHIYLAKSPGHWKTSHRPTGLCQTHQNRVVEGILTVMLKISNAAQGPNVAIIIIRQTLTFSKTLLQSLRRSRAHKNTQCISLALVKLIATRINPLWGERATESWQRDGGRFLVSQAFLLPRTNMNQ